MTSTPLDDQGPLPAPDAPPPPAARRTGRAWWWVAGGMALFLLVNAVVVAAVAGDWMLRSYEADRLVTRIEASEKAMIAFQSDLAVAYAVMGDPSTATDAQVARAQEMLAAAVDSGLPAIAAAGQEIEQLPIAPWHDSTEQARAAYAAHNHAWQDYLTRAQADPAELDKSQPTIDDTFMAAEPVVRKAVSSLGAIDLYDLKDRVDVIFAPPPQQQDPATGGDGGLQALAAVMRR